MVLIFMFYLQVTDDMMEQGNDKRMEAMMAMNEGLSSEQYPV